MKTILVTGAGSGIGHDTALSLAQSGHYVVATTHTEESAEQLSKEAKNIGVSIDCAKLDILSGEDRSRACERWEPEVLINNAAIGQSGPLAEIPIERLEANFATNVFATLALTQEIVKGMVKRGSGRIVIVGSSVGRIALPYFGAYAMTKFALEAAADVLRLELAPHDIFVSLIEPGKILTRFNKKMVDSKYEWFGDNSAFVSDVDRVKSYEKLILTGQGPTTSVVRAITHAVEARRPKPRYVMPARIAAALFLARILPDRVKDYFISRLA